MEKELQIGYDLVTDFAGYHDPITDKGDCGAWSTAQGESLSNFVPCGDTLQIVEFPNTGGTFGKKFYTYSTSISI